MKVQKFFRVEDWWVGKASLLIGLVYFFSIFFSISFQSFWGWAFLSFFTIVGFASFGYLVNDFFDQEKDALVGKKNFLIGKTALQKLLFLLIAILFMLSPWYFLPHNLTIFLLLFFQLFAFFIYSSPPIRLKEKGILGLIIDALYAHGIPSLLAAYTYTKIAGKSSNFLFLSLLLCWQFCVGIRNIVLHQINDLESDKQTKTKTFLQKNNAFLNAHSQLVLVILELSFLTLLLVYSSLQNILFLFPILFFAVSLICNFKMNEKNGYRIYFPNIFYEQWLPYSLILILIIADVRFLFLIPIHTILFSKNFVSQFIKQIPFKNYYSLTQKTLSDILLVIFIQFKILGNWLIYLAFRIIGVDLVKEKTDAKGYILKKINKQK